MVLSALVSQMPPPFREKRAGGRQSIRKPQAGFTLVELLIALAVAALLIAGLSEVVGQAFQVHEGVRDRNALTRDARYAMSRMAESVSRTSRLVLPLADNPATTYSEAVRDVLAVTLDPAIDRDEDGFADADNDRDGRVDEDPGDDNNNDGAPGILGIDDDNDGQIDEGGSADNDDDDEDADQTGNADEEILNGVDDDGDGAIDEDMEGDLNQDGESGVLGVDDDGDGDIDESNRRDDDEDEDETGNRNEDWYDTVVYFLQGAALVERMPNPHATSGLDYTENVIATDVSRLQVERLVPGSDDRAVLVEITLELTGTRGDPVELVRRVRVGGGQ